METLLKQLMNRGFLIYEHDTKFVLAKVPTPADHRSAITDAVKSNTSSVEFESYDKALGKAKELMDWKEPIAATHQTGKTGWRMQMLYSHYGFGTQFIELGEMGPVSYDMAVSEAEKRAAAYAESKSGEVETWEVRVRPFNRPEVPSTTSLTSTSSF